ncbi:MAG: hypothetical protein KKE96_04330 [Candidatus Altiarchaeota archaeon]|nr:hypothetical protein [Candidatus Altiarchaeota archaeon]MBU4342124.1 hypothetical protein [Candidatus Altiarchaeota archaeon]MCG2827202.1 hypothetical protein [Thermoplasmatales archaeon]
MRKIANFHEEAKRYILDNIERIIPDSRIVSYKSDAKINGHVADLFVILAIPNEIECYLIFEIKSRGEPVFLSHAITQLRSIPLSIFKRRYRNINEELLARIVVAPYISERGKQLCKSNGINFLDLSGNCYLHVGAYYIEKEGRENIAKERKILKELFSPKASRVARVMLEEPKRKWTLSELAKTAEISLGYVHRVVKKLQDHEFVSRDMESKLVLDKPGELLEQWTKKYNFSDNTIHTYYSFQKNITEFMKKVSKASKNKLEYAMTLHSGAYLIAPYVRFTDVHFYVKPMDVEKWVKKLDLRPVESGGTIHLVEPFDEGVFYGRQTVKGIKVVCNTQLYLDLYNYPARGKEQAKFLRKKKMRY